jgi:hypothetical protein
MKPLDCNGRVMAQLSIVRRPIGSIKPNDRNPRLHSNKQIGQIAKSIESFGFNVPILLDPELRVVAGHGRLLAAQLMGLNEVPTILLEHLTEAQAKAFVIADNKLTENGGWDDALLAEQLKTLTETELDFSLDATGFDVDGINLLIEDHTAACGSKGDRADRLPAAGSAVQISRPGDLWLLGPHRILCGNPLDQDCYATLMRNERAAMVIADPTTSDGVTNVGFTSFVKQLCARLVFNSTANSVHFLFVNYSFVSELATLGRQAYADSEGVRVWVKEGTGTGLLRSEQFALVLVFRNGKISGSQIDSGQTNRPTNVCTYAEANVASRSIINKRPRKPSGVAKPVAMLAAVLKDGSKSEDIVLDPFLDSGGTLVAAERTGRVCRGMEVDPAWVDTAIRRWQSFTGKSAIHGVSGNSFTEIEMEAIREFQR